MLTVLLVTQVIITLAMIGVIMIQRSSSDGLSGIGGGSGASGGGGLISSRGATTALTRATAFLAIAFMANALAMATITARSNQSQPSIIDEINSASDTQAPNVPAVPTASSENDEADAAPEVPVAE